MQAGSVLTASRPPRASDRAPLQRAADQTAPVAGAAIISTGSCRGGHDARRARNISAPLTSRGGPACKNRPPPRAARDLRSALLVPPCRLRQALPPRQIERSDRVGQPASSVSLCFTLIHHIIPVAIPTRRTTSVILVSAARSTTPISTSGSTVSCGGNQPRTRSPRQSRDQPAPSPRGHPRPPLCAPSGAGAGCTAASATSAPFRPYEL